METIYFFGVITIALFITQIAAYHLYRKTKKKLIGFLPTLVLMLLGGGVMVILALTQIDEVGSWIGLALAILGIVLAIVTILSLLVSYVIFFSLDKNHFNE